MTSRPTFEPFPLSPSPFLRVLLFVSDCHRHHVTNCFVLFLVAENAQSPAQRIQSSPRLVFQDLHLIVGLRVHYELSTFLLLLIIWVYNFSFFILVDKSSLFPYVLSVLSGALKFY